jgi:predicted Zn finger-like uncharacterized protein
MIEFGCPHCHEHIRVKDDALAGKSGKCNHCGQAITVPTLAEAAKLKGEADNATAIRVGIRVLLFLAAGWALLTLVGQANKTRSPPAVYYHTDRFKDDYADPATTNAVEAIEVMVQWLANHGTASIEFWLIVIAGLMVLLLIQTERLLIQRRRQ